MGFDPEMMGIPKIGEIGGTKLVAEFKQGGQTQQTNSSIKPEQKEVKLWDDYTARELADLRKNRRDVYVFLYALKYGVAPKI